MSTDPSNGCRYRIPDEWSPLSWEEIVGKVREAGQFQTNNEKFPAGVVTVYDRDFVDLLPAQARTDFERKFALLRRLDREDRKDSKTSLPTLEKHVAKKLRNDPYFFDDDAKRMIAGANLLLWESLSVHQYAASLCTVSTPEPALTEVVLSPPPPPRPPQPAPPDTPPPEPEPNPWMRVVGPLLLIGAIVLFAWGTLRAARGIARWASRGRAGHQTVRAVEEVIDIADDTPPWARTATQAPRASARVATPASETATVVTRAPRAHPPRGGIKDWMTADTVVAVRPAPTVSPAASSTALEGTVVSARRAFVVVADQWDPANPVLLDFMADRRDIEAVAQLLEGQVRGVAQRLQAGEALDTTTLEAARNAYRTLRDIAANLGEESAVARLVEELDRARELLLGIAKNA